MIGAFDRCSIDIIDYVISMAAGTIPGTYVSDGQETLCYIARKIYSILITAGSLTLTTRKWMTVLAPQIIYPVHIFQISN